MSRIDPTPSSSPFQLLARAFFVTLAIGIVAWLVWRAQRDAARNAGGDVGRSLPVADQVEQVPTDSAQLIELPPMLSSSKSLVIEMEGGAGGEAEQVPQGEPTLIFSSKSAVIEVPAGTTFFSDGSDPAVVPEATVLPSSKFLVIDPSKPAPTTKPTPRPAQPTGGSNVPKR